MPDGISHCRCPKFGQQSNSQSRIFVLHSSNEYPPFRATKQLIYVQQSQCHEVHLRLNAGREFGLSLARKMLLR